MANWPNIGKFYHIDWHYHDAITVWVEITSAVTVIETGTETVVFLLNRTEPKPRFYASVLTVRF